MHQLLDVQLEVCTNYIFDNEHQGVAAVTTSQLSVTTSRVTTNRVTTNTPSVTTAQVTTGSNRVSMTTGVVSATTSRVTTGITWIYFHTVVSLEASRSSDPTDSSNKVMYGAIGAGIGAIVIFGALIIIFVFYRRKRRNSERNTQHDIPMSK